MNMDTSIYNCLIFTYIIYIIFLYIIIIKEPLKINVLTFSIPFGLFGAGIFWARALKLRLFFFFDAFACSLFMSSFFCVCFFFFFWAILVEWIKLADKCRRLIFDSNCNLHNESFERLRVEWGGGGAFPRKSLSGECLGGGRALTKCGELYSHLFIVNGGVSSFFGWLYYLLHAGWV